MSKSHRRYRYSNKTPGDDSKHLRPGTLLWLSPWTKDSCCICSSHFIEGKTESLAVTCPGLFGQHSAGRISVQVFVKFKTSSSCDLMSAPLPIPEAVRKPQYKRATCILPISPHFWARILVSSLQGYDRYELPNQFCFPCFVCVVFVCVCVYGCTRTCLHTHVHVGTLAGGSPRLRSGSSATHLPYSLKQVLQSHQRTNMAGLTYPASSGKVCRRLLRVGLQGISYPLPTTYSGFWGLELGLMLTCQVINCRALPRPHNCF